MSEEAQKHKKILNMLYSLLITLLLFGVFLTVILAALDNIKQREAIEVTDRFITFENRVERLIYSNVTLLQGFEAYIETNPNLDEQGAYDYLEVLLDENSEYIRNVGVIQDTTIIWNYPKETNASAIGTDLSKIDSQKDNVLKVKNENVAIIQGPVELVQGGQGFIVRMPIVRNEIGYWGQISIVLKSQEINSKVSEFADEADLNIAVFNQTDPETPFLGDLETVGEESLSFTIDKSFINWKVYFSPESGWHDHTFYYALFILLAVMISGFVGFISFKGMKSQFQLKMLSTLDALTGLYNRRFLDDYQNNILEYSKKDGKKFGLVSLDINSFKEINDTYGHIMGDKVLIETARLLKKLAGNGETVFRTGGDEFLIILPNKGHIKEMESFNNYIKELFANEFSIAESDIKATPSIGFSIFPDDGEDIDTLLHKADKEMYKEKSKEKSKG